MKAIKFMERFLSSFCDPGDVNFGHLNNTNFDMTLTTMLARFVTSD